MLHGKISFQVGDFPTHLLHLWQLSVGRGFVVIDDNGDPFMYNGTPADLFRIRAVSVFHQLHCLVRALNRLSCRQVLTFLSPERVANRLLFPTASAGVIRLNSVCPHIRRPSPFRCTYEALLRLPPPVSHVRCRYNSRIATIRWWSDTSQRRRLG